MTGPAGARALASPWPEVALWWVDLDQPPPAPALAWLDEGERQRAAAFAFETLRRRYVAAHVALRGLLGAHLGADPAALHIVAGAQGKPALAGSSACRFSLSHAAGGALVALSDRCELGVDLEMLRELPEVDMLAEQQFAPGERAALHALPPARRSERFLRTWTRKEACLKAVGCGLMVSAAGFETGPADSPAAWTTRVEGQAVQVVPLALAAGWVGALARLG